MDRKIGRRQSDFKIQERLHQHTQLFNIGQTITSETDLDSLFEIITNQTNQVMQTERATVFLYDSEVEELWSLVATGMKDIIIRIPKDHGAAGWVFNHREAAIINDPYNDQRFFAGVDKNSGFKTRNILSVPLISRKGDCIGVLQTLNKKDSEFSKEDLNLLTSVSHYVAISLENSQLIEELKEKKKQIEQELKSRVEFGYIFISIVLMITLYSFFTVVLKQFEFVQSNKGLIEVVSRTLEVIFIVGSVFIVFKSRLPLKFFGLTLDNSKQAIKESMLVTLWIMAGMAVVKWLLLRYTNVFGDEFVISAKYLDWSYLTYIIVAPIQELITRGVFQSTLQRLILGKYNWLWAVLLTSFMFGMFHIHQSILLGVISISLSTLWGFLYARHKTIVGISISHFLVGNWAGLTGIWSFFAIF
jgi:membrane protease YdiL (CAAX protease family)